MSLPRIEDLQKEAQTRQSTQYKPGQTVRVTRTIREGEKERQQSFEGLIIETKNQNNSAASITVRRIIGGIGVEQVFPIHSPLIVSIELIKEAKVRRARLFYMRERFGKSARLKERFMSQKEKEAYTLKNVVKATEPEAPVADDSAEASEEAAA